MPFNFKPAFDRALHYTPFLERYATAEHRDRWKKVYDAAALTDAQRTLLAGFTRKMPVLCMSGPWCGDCVNACPLFERIAEASRGMIDLRFVNRAQKFDAATPQPLLAPTQPDEDDIRSRPIGKWLVRMGILNEERVDKALLMQEEVRSRGLNVKIGDVMTQQGWITESQRDQALASQSGFETLDEADRQVAIELSICGAPRVPMLVFFSQDWFECGRFGERTLATYRDKIAKMQGASCSTGLFAPPTDLLAANLAEWLTHFERVQLMLQTSPRLMKMNGEV